MLGISLTEGKKPMPFAAYKYLAQVLFESKEPQHSTAHTFLILDWNHFSCAELVVEAKIDSFGVMNDAIYIEIGKTKTDQEGT